MHYLLFYEVVDDYADRRNQFRSAHLAYAEESIAQGELLLGGAYANPVDGAVLLFNCSDSSIAETFAKSDPYVLNGLVTKWYVREWTTIVGPMAANPIGKLE